MKRTSLLSNLVVSAAVGALNPHAAAADPTSTTTGKPGGNAGMRDVFPVFTERSFASVWKPATGFNPFFKDDHRNRPFDALTASFHIFGGVENMGEPRQVLLRNRREVLQVVTDLLGLTANEWRGGIRFGSGQVALAVERVVEVELGGAVVQVLEHDENMVCAQFLVQRLDDGAFPLPGAHDLDALDFGLDLELLAVPGPIPEVELADILVRASPTLRPPEKTPLNPARLRRYFSEHVSSGKRSSQPLPAPVYGA